MAVKPRTAAWGFFAAIFCAANTATGQVERIGHSQQPTSDNTRLVTSESGWQALQWTTGQQREVEERRRALDQQRQRQEEERRLRQQQVLERQREAQKLAQRELERQTLQQRQETQRRQLDQQMQQRRDQAYLLQQRAREQSEQQGRIHSRSTDICAKYKGRGYSTDYIELRLGVRPIGPAAMWPGIATSSEIRVGDAALLAVGRLGHVVYVEELIWALPTREPSHLRVSEMNWGPTRTDHEGQTCHITAGFGIRNERTISVREVDRIWRPM